MPYRETPYTILFSPLYRYKTNTYPFLEKTKLHTLLCYENLFTHQLGYAVKSRKLVIKIGTELKSIHANINKYMIYYMPLEFSYVNNKSQRLQFSFARRVSSVYRLQSLTVTICLTTVTTLTISYVYQNTDNASNSLCHSV